MSSFYFSKMIYYIRGFLLKK